MCLVWPEDATAGGPDAPLQHGLWKPEEEWLGREGSVEVQSTSSKIFEVSNQIFSPFYYLYFDLLRSKMSQELANKKFLEAMMLLSYTRELWEMNELYMMWKITKWFIVLISLFVCTLLFQINVHCNHGIHQKFWSNMNCSSV